MDERWGTEQPQNLDLRLQVYESCSNLRRFEHSQVLLRTGVTPLDQWRYESPIPASSLLPMRSGKVVVDQLTQSSNTPRNSNTLYAWLREVAAMKEAA